MSKYLDNETINKLNQLKTEFASETGFEISQYNNMDKGNLTSRLNGHVGGYIGGTMTKQLVELGKQKLKEIDNSK